MTKHQLALHLIRYSTVTSNYFPQSGCPETLSWPAGLIVWRLQAASALCKHSRRSLCLFLPHLCGFPPHPTCQGLPLHQHYPNAGLCRVILCSFPPHPTCQGLPLHQHYPGPHRVIFGPLTTKGYDHKTPIRTSFGQRFRVMIPRHLWGFPPHPTCQGLPRHQHRSHARPKSSYQGHPTVRMQGPSHPTRGTQQCPIPPSTPPASRPGIHPRSSSFTSTTRPIRTWPS